MNTLHRQLSNLNVKMGFADLPPRSHRCWWMHIPLLCICLLIAGCGTESPEPPTPTSVITAADVDGPRVWGAAQNVTRLKHLYFSAQPDAAGLAAAKAAGVEVVINLREPEEINWDEASAAAQQSLAYFQVPLAGKSTTFDRAAMQRISELVKANHDKQIWLHCSSGNRAAAWLAVHLVQDHKMMVEPALMIARQTGITRQEVEARVRTYLGVPVTPESTEAS